jgi:hypothetical protein
MTTSDELTTTTRATDAEAALPLHPWSALHPATGMLLGLDDFEVMMGNPRAKHMLHSAWEHGRGVVWGLDVSRSGDRELTIDPGLAKDGIGRELHVDSPRCVDVRPLLDADHDPTCGTYEVELCLVLRFDACLNAAVPALPDPCDVTRETTEYSRVVERAVLELVRGTPDNGVPPYHRVRVLLGLEDVGEDDEAGDEAWRCREELAACPAEHRAQALLRHFRCLAAKDAADWHPSRLVGDYAPNLFPVEDDDSGVVLACITVTVRDESGCPEIVDLVVDTCRRPTLVPTTVLQDLVCGLAPGLIGTYADADGGGPKLIPDSVTWSEDARVLTFRVTADLVPGSVRRAVKLTSLAEREWVEEDLMGPPRYDDSTRTIVVELADRPVNPLVRLLVRGTGSTPVYGSSPVAPLAGIVGGPPGTVHEGRDAVLTLANPLLEGSAES